MQNLIKSICSQYKDDPSTPSLLCSRVDNRWYFSIVRYNSKYGIDKFVVVNGLYEEFNTGIEKIRKKWLISLVKNIKYMKKHNLQTVSTEEIQDMAKISF